MKIGFDAKRAFQNYTGLGNYSRTLIETFAAYCPDIEMHFFAPKITENQRVAHLKNLGKIHSPQGIYRKIHPFWRTFAIENDIKQSEIQIFHGLSHELPLSMPRNVRTVVTMHDLIHERYPQFYSLIDRKIYTAKFKSACRRADKIVAISEQTKRDIIDFYNIEADKIQVIYQSCHRQFYAERPPSVSVIEKYNLPAQFALYVGTINERKNLLNIVKAIESIDYQNLVVIGDGGKYYQKVLAYIQQKGLQNRIVIRSKVDFADMPAMYATAQLLCFPSYFEGFGLPIIESLWSGTPVVTSTGSCFAEAGGAGALYVAADDTNAIAEAIEKINADTHLRNDLILRGGQYVEKFRAENIAQQWHALYQSLI